MGSRLQAALLGCVLGLSACNLHDPDAYLTGPSRDVILTVTAQPTQLPADGQSRTRITAQIDPRTAPANRTISFSSSAGTLLGTRNAQGVVEVTADSAGVAMIELQAPRQASAALVQASIDNFSRTVEVQFQAIDPAAAVRLDPASSTAPADGVSVTRLALQVGSGWLPADRRVEVTTTLGTFDGEANSGFVTVDVLGRATFDLRSPTTTGSARVRATASNASADATVQFVRALPEQVLVKTSAAFLGASQMNDVTITAQLRRDLGIPTKDTVVVFSAVDNNGATIGFFSDVILSGTDGNATAKFSVGATAYRGPVTVIATVPSAGNLRGEVRVEIVDP